MTKRDDLIPVATGILSLLAVSVFCLVSGGTASTEEPEDPRELVLAEPPITNGVAAPVERVVVETLASGAAFSGEGHCNEVAGRLEVQQISIQHDLEAIRAYLEDDVAAKRGDIKPDEKMDLGEYEAQEDPESEVSKKLK
jgi:hypothetical protein